MDSRPQQRRTGRPSALAYAALLALGLFQLAYANHDSQHALGDVAETCDVCVHLDQPGSAPTDTTPAVAAVARSISKVSFVGIELGHEPTHLPPTRGPPLS